MNPLLSLEQLSVEFRTDEGPAPAVRGMSFELARGETLAIVGESGSGKTVANLALLGLTPPSGRVTAGRALFDGRDLLRLPAADLRAIRGRRIAMVFQDPLTALNPYLTIAEQLTEMTRLHLGHTRKQARSHAVAMLEQVGIPAAERRLDDYPHQFSGGMRQRVMIAMALSCRPDLLIADEPTTALDVTIQAQILELLANLQREHQMAVILITHDLGVVAGFCRRVLVMYAGRVVEETDVDSLFARPQHPYTLGLLQSAPRWDGQQSTLLKAIPGQPPRITDLPSGCAFHPRCPYRLDRCSLEAPPDTPREGSGRRACFADVAQLALPPAAAAAGGAP